MGKRKMRPYGMGAGDYPCCCPGHDKYSSKSYENRRSEKAHTEMTKKLHRKGRRQNKIITKEYDGQFC